MATPHSNSQKTAKAGNKTKHGSSKRRSGGSSSKESSEKRPATPVSLDKRSRNSIGNQVDKENSPSNGSDKPNAVPQVVVSQHATGGSQASSSITGSYQPRSRGYNPIKESKQVEFFVREDLFKKLKFVRDQSEMLYTENENSICQYVCKGLHVDALERHSWWAMEQKAVDTHLNKKRTDVNGTMKKAFIGRRN
jgi:hypothetical protein